MNLVEHYLVQAKKEMEWSVNDKIEVQHKQIAATRGLTFAVMAAVIAQLPTMNQDALDVLSDP